MNAATVVIRIRYVKDPLGRPRFEPSPALRRLGYRGHYLVHADGRRYGLQECQDFVARLLAEAALRRAAKAAGQRPRPAKRPSFYTVADLFAELWRDPRFNPGSSRVRTLAPATIRSYRGFANALMAYDEELWAAPAAAVSRVAAHGLYQKLYAEKGLHMARHIVATCRMAWSWAGRHGKVEANPWKDLGMETPDGRRRAASPAEIRHLVAVADGAGRPEIGDMIWLGLITAQRQADRLLMRSHQLAQGRFHVRQRKTGKTVTGPLGPVLAARLAAAQARRKNHRVAHPFAVIDERARAPFKADHYRHVFAAVVAKAALTMPGLAGFRDQDLRDTALTWARQGGASFEQRRGLSGHGPQAAQIEERHYLAGAGSPGDDAVAAILRVWQGEPGP